MRKRLKGSDYLRRRFFMSNILNERAVNANRQGRLTLPQAISLLPMILLGALFIGLAAFNLVGVVNSFGAHKGDPFVNALIGGGLAIGFLWLGFMIGGKQLIDILIGRVRTIDGRASKVVSRDSSGKVLFFSVDTVDFKILWTATWKALPEGIMVRAYYTPRSKSLVNIEPLSTGS